jgi:hypothetical protein
MQRRKENEQGQALLIFFMIQGLLKKASAGRPLSGGRGVGRPARARPTGVAARPMKNGLGLPRFLARFNIFSG